MNPSILTTFVTIALLAPLCYGQEPALSLNVKDLGALGDGKHNDAPAFKEALVKLKNVTGPKELVIPNGTYFLKPAEEDKAHITIMGEKYLTIRGAENTILVFGSAFHDGIYITRSENVKIESFAVDYRPLPFTQGTITEVSPKAKSFILKLDKGFPRVTDAQISGKNTQNILYVFDGDSTIKMNGFRDQYIGKMEALDDDHAKITGMHSVSAGMAGKRAALVGRRKANAITFDHATGCTAKKVTVHSAPALGFSLQSSDDITVDGCKIIQLPGSGRLMSIVADGVHVKWGKAGPKILNCHFEGMGDDSVNIGGTYQMIYDQPDPRTLIVINHGSLAPGKNIMWIHNKTGNIERLPECTKVSGAKYDGKPAMKLTFAEDLPDIPFTASKGDTKSPDLVINYDNVPSNPVIRGNFFGRHRMRGILMRSPGAIIEHNRFEDLLGPGIMLGHHYGGRIEGPNGSHCIIRNNIFVNIQRSPISLSDSGPAPFSKRNEPARSIEDVQIVGNEIRLYGKPSFEPAKALGSAILIDNSHNVLLEDNIIGERHPESPIDVPPIVIAEAAEVTIKGTKVIESALVNGEWLRIEDTADKKSISISP